jgi:hypothetical protein
VDLQGKEDWLGGLDSNQDSQIQNLKSCQLDDLPVVVNKRLNGPSLGEKEAFSLCFTVGRQIICGRRDHLHFRLASSTS